MLIKSTREHIFCKRTTLCARLKQVILFCSSFQMHRAKKGDRDPTFLLGFLIKLQYQLKAYSFQQASEYWRYQRENQRPQLSSNSAMSLKDDSLICHFIYTNSNCSPNFILSPWDSPRSEWFPTSQSSICFNSYLAGKIAPPCEVSRWWQDFTDTFPLICIHTNPPSQQDCT